MNEPSDPKFLPTIWRVVWPDFKRGFSRIGRLLTETAITGVLTWRVLEKFGSKEAPLDSTVERIAILGVALIWPALHILWSIATIPWKLYCEQQKKLAALSRENDSASGRIAALENRPESSGAENLKVLESELRHKELQDRLASVKSVVSAQVDSAPNNILDLASFGSDWIYGTWEILRRNIKFQYCGQFQQFTKHFEVSPGCVVRMKACLMEILASLTIESMTRIDDPEK